MKRSSLLTDLILLQILAVIAVSYYFRGATSICDGVMHLSKVKILLDNLRTYGYFPRWNPYWYFGVPMWRIYSPLSYHILAFLGWILDLSLQDIAMIWAYLVFSLASMSTCLLAREMGLKRMGCFVSSILFPFSANLILYWGIGSYPTVTGVAISPLALFFFLRAVKKRNKLNTLAAGVTFGGLILIYLMNAIILFVFFSALSILMVVRDPSLLYVSRGLQAPPRYDLVLPRIVAAIILVALGVSMWWLLLFFVTYFTAPAIPGTTVGPPPAPRSLGEQLMLLLGVQPNMESPGIGHFVLATIACIVAFVKRKTETIYAPACFVVAFILCLTPWLRIPTGPLFWRRFTLYLSLFASISAATLVDMMRGFCEQFLDRKSSINPRGEYLKTFYSSSLVVLILVAAIYPVVGNESIVFPGYDISEKPVYVNFLESHSRSGERVGMGYDYGYIFNLYTGIPQSAGGNVHYVYMVNEFAYMFWLRMFEEQDSRYLRYFARSYNVRWFVGTEMSGLERTDQELPYEVAGFSSSLAENIGADSRVLFIGDDHEYSWFYLSIALSDAQDIVPAYGGKTLDGYNAATIREFGALYISGLRSMDLLGVSQLLSEYAGGGGCLILDTGNPQHEGETTGLPEPSPVESVKFGESHLMLEPTSSHDVTVSLDLSEFRSDKAQTISHSNSTRNGAGVLIHDEGEPVLAYWEWGLGKVFWTGLRLPYLIILDEKDKAKSEEEAKLLINLLRQADSAEKLDSKGIVRFEQKSPEEIVVHVKDGSLRDALWLKMSYYPGWTAQIEDQSHTQLRIFTAGPNMMLVFPRKSGDYAVKFYFGKTLDVMVGEVISVVSLVTLLALTLYTAATQRSEEAGSPKRKP